MVTLVRIRNTALAAGVMDDRRPGGFEVTHFEHNYGPGHQNLSVVLAMLMMLAFLMDQFQQLCCPQFAAAWERCISKRALWERMREIFQHDKLVLR